MRALLRHPLRKRKRFIGPAFVTVAFLWLAGCGHTGYRVVKLSGTGGIVALEGPRKEARPSAEEYMRGRCFGRGYEILKEGAADGMGVDTAYRIEYRCTPAKGAAEN
jgi:hypothetical protein